MSHELVWEDPQPKKSRVATATAMMMANPGRWARVPFTAGAGYKLRDRDPRWEIRTSRNGHLRIVHMRWNGDVA